MLGLAAMSDRQMMSARLRKTVGFAGGLLLTLARSPLAGALAGWLYAHMSFAIPVSRLRETSTLLAFYHPRPSYPVHILIVPKRRWATLMELDPSDSEFLADLARTVQSLVAELNLEANGYRLVSNGGAFQDVPHLHFHLIAETPV